MFLVPDRYHIDNKEIEKIKAKRCVCGYETTQSKSGRKFTLAFFKGQNGE